MIDNAIIHITGQLNQFLRTTFDLSEDLVVVSNLLEQDGSTSAQIENKVVAFLVNIEREGAVQRQPNGKDVGSSRSVTSYPPLYLNFYLMFAGHFSGSNYVESLKFLSNTISFFQRRPVFDHQTTPDLDDRIEKLVLEIQNLDFRDLATLWGVLSGKYLPSVLYKVRMVVFDAQDVRAQVHTMQQPVTLSESL